jgi:dephospho-CoA kinase
MPVIGLTGNIGSGKSTVSRRLKDLGAEVIDADQVAREVVRRGSPALEELVANFGPGILGEDGELDRKATGELVFADPRARALLNEITHARIKESIRCRVKEFQDQNNSSPGPEVLVIDAALLIEVGLHNNADEIWVVKISEEKQLERLTQRDGLSPDEVRQRIAAQLPQEEKLKYAHRVIDNSGEQAETIRQVDMHMSNLLKGHFRVKQGI